MRIQQVPKQRIKVLFFCILTAFFCITINSKNSFLYCFNESVDLHCFITTARCMLHGDVLYRDVYEHRGPIFYFFYAIAMSANPLSLRGIYIMEWIFYTVFLFFTHKIAALYFEESKSLWTYLITAVVGIVVSCCNDFMTGGQTEELALPFLTASVYFVIRYLRQQYPAKIRFRDILWIGICFAVIFWMKYSICGLYLGLVLFVIVLQIRDRKTRELFLYMGQFLLAFLIGSLPVLIYFGIHRSFDSLFESYFYNLLFVYSGGGYQKGAFFLSEEFVIQYLGNSALLAPVVIFLLLSGKDNFSVREKAAIILMFFFECLGVSATYNWGYSKECLYAFSVFGPVAIVLILTNLNQWMETAKEIVTRLKTIPHIAIVIATAAVGLLVLNPDYMLPLELELAIAALLCRNTWKRCKPIVYILAGIIGFAAKMFYETEFLANICLLFLVFQFPLLYDWIKQQIPTWKREYEEKKGKYQITIVSVLSVLFLVFLVRYSSNLPDISKTMEEYPQYQISEYIKQESVDPVILYYDTLDLGIYWLTGTYPPGKYFCTYNIKLDEKEEMMDAYLTNDIADFIISYNKLTDEDLSSEKYRLVYEGTYSGRHAGLCPSVYYLYQKK